MSERLKQLGRFIAGVSLGVFLAFLVLFLIGVGGCGGIIRDADLKAPNAPLRIEKVDCRALHVSYINERGDRVMFDEMIHVNGQLEGWVLTR